MDRGLGYFMNSGILFGVARGAYERLAESASSDLEGGQNDALVALVFSAATLEAFIMELAQAAKIDVDLGVCLPFILDLANALHEVERSRGSIRLKYLVTKSILPGASFDRGKQPFQDFDLLFSLRDSITHMKPEEVKNEEHKLIKRLGGLKIDASQEANHLASWIHRVTTRATARWSINTVARMTGSLRECLSQQASLSPAVNAIVTMQRFCSIDEKVSSDE